MIQSIDELLIAHLFASLSRNLFDVVRGELRPPSPAHFPLLLHQKHQSVHVRIHRNVHF